MVFEYECNSLCPHIQRRGAEISSAQAGMQSACEGRLGRPTTLKDDSSGLVDVHHLLHDRLKHAPELAICQARLKRDVQSVVLAGTKADFVNAAGAREEQLTVSVKADSHDPATSNTYMCLTVMMTAEQ